MRYLKLEIILFIWNKIKLFYWYFWRILKFENFNELSSGLWLSSYFVKEKKEWGREKLRKICGKLIMRKVIMQRMRFRKQEKGMWWGEETERDCVVREEGECKKKGKGSWLCHVAWLEWKSGLGFQQRARERAQQLSLSCHVRE